MKKSLSILCITLFFLSCNSDNTKADESTSTEVKSDNPVGIQNVNGNMPDTVNTIDIGTHKPNEITGTDSLIRDTSKKD